jgi:hypothetical protein
MITNVIKYSAIVFVLIGLLNFALSMIGVLDYNQALGEYIGGTSGALWALAGVLLFWQALLLQREEIKQVMKGQADAYVNQQKTNYAQAMQIQVMVQTGILNAKIAELNFVIEKMKINPDHRKNMDNATKHVFETINSTLAKLQDVHVPVEYRKVKADDNT